MYFGSYTCIIDHILVLRILYLYYRAYTCISDLIIVVRSLFLCFRSYTCITELILVLQILYLYYETYSCILDLILIFRNIYLSFGTYTCIPEHILVLRILYLYYGYGSTHRYYRRDTEVPVDTVRAELNSFLSYCSLFKFTWFMFHDFIIQIGTYGTHRFILVHISRKAHIGTYIRFIYLYRSTYTRTCPYHSSLSSIYVYGDTRRYYRNYTYTTEFTLVCRYP